PRRRGVIAARAPAWISNKEAIMSVRLFSLAKAAVLAVALLIAGVASAAAQNARTLTIAFPTNVATFDPHQTATIYTDMSLLAHLYDALVTRGPDLRLQPQLATQWRAVDQTTWRLTLRSGATFANGEKLDAAA